MRILVLAGGFDQIALIKELKKRGHIVLLADYFENPPAKLYADRHFVISTLDENAIQQLAVKENVELITTACTDQALMTVANVSEKLGLPCYLSSEMARNVTNKAYMKKRFFQYSIPTAAWRLLEDEHVELCPSFQESQFPLIVKPCDCNSSKGVVKVANADELHTAIEQAFVLSRSKKVIVEQFEEGEEVSIDVWKDQMGAKVLSVTGTSKIAQNSESFTIYQSKYPVLISEKLIANIQETAEKICTAFELDNCPILIQAIIQGDKLSVIEFSARMGGGSKYKLVEYISGIDIMKVYVDRILGDTKQIISPIWSTHNIELNYVYAYDGVYTQKIGFDRYLKIGAIREVFDYKLPGAVIEKRTTSSDRILGFLLEENTQEDLEKQRKTILQGVDILDANGNSIMYKECFCR